MNRVDIAHFEFDFDTTWAAFFTDSKLRIYSRYGGRDEHEPESRLSKSSLLQTMRESLDAHKLARATVTGGAEAVPPAAPIWHPEPISSTTPLDIPLLKKSHNGCVHCHQIREYSLLQAYHDKRFQREMLFTYPLPESLGIEVDRVHGHRVAKVGDGSPAADAKLSSGDIITRCAEVPIRSDLDLRWALHRLPPTSKRVTLLVERQMSNLGDSAARSTEIVLSLPNGWRQSELSCASPPAAFLRIGVFAARCSPSLNVAKPICRSRAWPFESCRSSREDLRKLLVCTKVTSSRA